MKVLIQSPAPRPDKSLSFYSKLGFEKTDNYVSDGRVVIEINPESSARLALKFYQESWDETVSKIEKRTAVKTLENMRVLMDPNGVFIYLLEDTLPASYPKASIGKGILGKYAGISIETISIQDSVDFYTQFGFTVNMGSVDQGWITMENEDATIISFMEVGSCPHSFTNPSLTYFNGGKNLPIIEGIRKAGIDITEEVTVFNKQGVVDNIIIRDPGGLGFFIFND